MLALAEPVPLTFASFIAKSLIDGIIFIFWHGHNKDRTGLAPLVRKWAKWGFSTSIFRNSNPFHTELPAFKSYSVRERPSLYKFCGREDR